MKKPITTPQVGETYTLRRKTDFHKGYPFGRLPVPVRITGDFPTYLTAVVLEHINPSTIFPGPSYPYSITIDKHEIKLGIMILKKEDKII